MTARGVIGQLATIALGLLGAVAAWEAGMPMPWLLGPMAATAAAALLGTGPRVSPDVRSVMLTVLGVLLGSAFTMKLVSNAGVNAATLALLVPYTVVATVLIFLMLLRSTRLDPVTAFFSAVPGGVNEMILMGTERGGDETGLAVNHSIRLFMVVFSVSAIFGVFFGYVRSGSNALPLVLSPWQDYLAIGGLGAVGAWLGVRLRLPARFLLGPMAVSAAAHLAGFTAVRPDVSLVALAQIVTGSAIGSRFAQLPRDQVVGALLVSLRIAVMLLGFTFAYVLAIQPLVGRPLPELLLAFAPGGLAEMGLIALTLGQDAGFVSVSQVCRFFVVVSLAVPMFRFARRLDARIRPAPSP